MNVVNRIKNLPKWVQILLVIILIMFLTPVFYLSVIIILMSFGTPVVLALLLGLYLRCTYRYIWGVTGHEGRRFIISAVMFIIILALCVIEEILYPSLPGPFMWAITDRPIDYPSTWADNWRLWWIGVMLQSSLFFSIAITYVLRFARRLGLNQRRKSAISEER